MYLTVIGLNHNQAGIDLREKLSFTSAELPEALLYMKEELAVEECLLLSTCNRIEIYLVHAGQEIDGAGFLAKSRRATREEIMPCLYQHEGAEVARHLFRVVSSLDSMIVGENQILNQVKEAYQVASDESHTARILNQLFQQALHVGKRIRTETGIGEGGISVPSLGVKLAGKIFADLTSKTILLLGTGETGKLALESFRNEGATRILVANRTLGHAEELSPEAYPLNQVGEILPKADIVVAALSGQEYLITPDQVESALRVRRREPILFLDLAVPRNIHPGIKVLEDAYLFNLDDLQAMAAENIRARQNEITACDPIIKEEVERFLKQWGELDLHEILAQLHKSFRDIGEEELQKSLPRLQELNSDQREEVQHLVRRTIGKILHSPTAALKRETEGATLLDLVSRLFGLSRKKSAKKPKSDRKQLTIK